MGLWDRLRSRQGIAVRTRRREEDGELVGNRLYRYDANDEYQQMSPSPEPDERDDSRQPQDANGPPRREHRIDAQHHRREPARADGDELLQGVRIPPIEGE